MAKFGLGKGLHELETEAGQAPEIATLAGIPERVVVKQIPIKQIRANPDQPRKTFSKDELNDLADSIKEHGVLQPIIVRTVAGEPNSYEIVAGERRWRASGIAGLDTIPALVKPLSNENAMEIALIENVQRENLNAIEESEAYQNIIEKLGYTLSDLSRLIGKSESYIRNILRLDILPNSVKELVKSGQISASHARTLSVSGNADELAKKIIAENLSVADVSNLVKQGPRADTAIRAGRKKPTGYQSEFIKTNEREIEDRLNLKAKISVRASGSGAITIKFNNKQELELLIGLLKKR